MIKDNILGFFFFFRLFPYWPENLSQNKQTIVLVLATAMSPKASVTYLTSSNYILTIILKYISNIHFQLIIMEELQW